MHDFYLEIILIDCLDALDRGDDLEQILQRYPAHRSDLEGPLWIVSYLTTIQIRPTHQAEAQSRARFLRTASHVKLQQGCDRRI